ncbi:MAG: UDP-glucose 4-epimerase GalE [bacterium]
MRVLVTGGAGYIGSVTVSQLQRAGVEIEVLDDLSTGHRRAVASDAVFHQGSLTDTALLDEVFRHPFDAVIHFAAFSQVGESVRDPLRYYRNNVVGTLALLQRVAAGGAGRLVFSSSAAVYGEPTTLPIPESAPLNPVNPYGRTKLAMEWAIADAAASAGFAAVALRYFNAAGAEGDLGEDHDPETHLIPCLLRSLLRPAGEFCIFGQDYDTPDGTCVRDYIHVSDLAAAHVLAVNRIAPPGFSALNLGTSRGHSVREIVDAAAAVTGHELSPRIEPRRSGDPARLVASNTLAAEQLGWQPERSDIQSILHDAWRWHQAFPHGY